MNPKSERAGIVPHIVMGVMALYFLLPFWWLLVAATKDNDGLFQSAPLWFSDFHLIDNLKTVFSQENGIYLVWLRNSALYAVVSGVGATAVSALAGYAFAKLRFPGRTKLFALLLGLIMVPATALVLPTYLLMSKAGGMAMVLLVLSQLAGNQFGFDRNGFRVYVLSPAERGSILIGKNLALAPFALGLTAAMVVVFQFVYPMEVAHFAATLIQTVTMYFLYCLFENILSMIAPMPVAQGSLKPYKPTGMQLLIHFLFLLMSPVALSAALIPLAIEYLVNLLGFASFPAYLTFSIVECGLVLTLYPFVVRLQGDLLQQRERTILEVVAGRVD